MSLSLVVSRIHMFLIKIWYVNSATELSLQNYDIMRQGIKIFTPNIKWYKRTHQFPIEIFAISKFMRNTNFNFQVFPSPVPIQIETFNRKHAWNRNKKQKSLELRRAIGAWVIFPPYIDETRKSAMCNKVESTYIHIYILYYQSWLACRSVSRLHSLSHSLLLSLVSCLLSRSVSILWVSRRKYKTVEDGPQSWIRDIIESSAT